MGTQDEKKPDDPHVHRVDKAAVGGVPPPAPAEEPTP